MHRPFQRIPLEQLPATPHRPHAWLELEERQVRTVTPRLGAVRTSYRTFGEGPPLLLVHGLMTTGYSWRYAYETLGEHFQVFMPDLPGAGRTPFPDADLTPDALCEWMMELLRALDIIGCAAIGNSMGGYLTMQLALHRPGALSRLVQLHGPALPTPRLWALWAAMRAPGADALLRRLVQRDPLRWAHRNVHYYDESLKSLEEAREYGTPLGTSTGFNGFASQLRHTMSAPALAKFQRTLRTSRPFPIPLCLIYAETDPMVPPAVGDVLYQMLPEATYIRMPQASHFAHVDASERFVARALEFLRPNAR